MRESEREGIHFMKVREGIMGRGKMRECRRKDLRKKRRERKGKERGR